MSMSYLDHPNYHRHKCSNCGTIWEHSPTFQARISHECPRCEGVCVVRYTGPEPPTKIKKAVQK